MQVAVLGTGRVGSTLANALAAKGHTVRFGSRDPGRHDGTTLPVLEHAEAISSAEVVINATPGALALETLMPLREAIGSRVLLDVTNAVTPQFGLMYPNSSLAAHLQEALPQAKVVKSLNTVNTSVMGSPGVLSGRSTIFISGNDAGAKATVSRLLADIGWTAEHQLDLGDISTARAPEHYFLLFGAAARALGSPRFNITIVR